MCVRKCNAKKEMLRNNSKGKFDGCSMNLHCECTVTALQQQKQFTNEYLLVLYSPANDRLLFFFFFLFHWRRHTLPTLNQHRMCTISRVVGKHHFIQREKQISTISASNRWMGWHVGAKSIAWQKLTHKIGSEWLAAVFVHRISLFSFCIYKH